MSVRGAVSGALTFELHGIVRAKQEQKIPLFGPAGQVRIEEATIDGARATIGFDDDHYFLLTSSRSFTLRGRLTLGPDQMLSVPGPLVSFDATLSKGRLVEGDKLSALAGTLLHFDPLTGDEAAAQPKKAPPLFRLSRSLRFGSEVSFVYRLASSSSVDLGVVRLPLALGENVKDVQGVTGWSVEDGALLLPTQGHEADVTISGTMPEKVGPRSIKLDERSAYEWWMIEHDPEHRVEVGGEGKLVDNSQSPIPPTTPNATTYLVQRGQRLEVEARSLVRGDVLAAVARTHKRFVAVTGRGELISDELVSYENHGLDHLMIRPAGKAIYVSTDAHPERILHIEQGSADVLVPVAIGSHQLRVQSLSDVRISPLAGAIPVPSSSYPLATSASEVTIGLPEGIHPVAILGGDRVRWATSRGDLLAVALGAAVACFGFRKRSTRALGAFAMTGLWYVSREAFVAVSGALFVAGAIFLASRFVRGTRLFAASSAVLVAVLFTGRAALQSDATAEPKRDLFVDAPELPAPERDYGVTGKEASLTSVSLSFPASDRYVRSSRQLVSRERPFVPRIVYVTSSLVAVLHLVWATLLLALGWMHKDRVIAWKDAAVSRLMRRPQPDATGMPTLEEPAPPF